MFEREFAPGSAIHYGVVGVSRLSAASGDRPDSFVACTLLTESLKLSFELIIACSRAFSALVAAIVARFQAGFIDCRNS